MIENRKTKWKATWKAVKRDWQITALGAWPTLLILVFSYGPMFGILYSFQKVGIRTSIWENEWVGLQYFKEFFAGYYWKRMVRNTFVISTTGMALGTVTSIGFALLINEVKDGRFKKTFQSFSYFPYFISLTVVVGLMKAMLDPRSGVLNLAAQKFLEAPAVDYFQMKEAFLPMYLVSNLWQGLGWSTIIYLGAIGGIDPGLYEAASIDGCGRLGKMWHITLQGIKPVIITIMILDIGNVLTLGHTKVLLMQTPLNKEVSDVISLHVYQRGLAGGNYGYGSAVGFMNSLIDLTLTVSANALSRKLTEESLF